MERLFILNKYRYPGLLTIFLLYLLVLNNNFRGDVVMPYAIDLFCGAGGFSEGIIQAGFDIVFSSDKSPMVKETYTNRHHQLGLIDGVDTHFELIDIKKLTADIIFKSINNLKYGNIFQRGTIDAIFGGPPCQGFSRLGKRDSKDPRNMLFHEYLRLIRDIMPKYVVMENVTGILDMHMLDFPSVIGDKIYSGQNLVKNILRNELSDLGYVLLDEKVLNAADFGVPQQRNRAIFLAYRKDMSPIKYPTPKKNSYVTVYDALGDLYTDKKYSTDFSKKSVLGRTRATNGKTLKRTTITNMELSKHDPSVTERFSLYKQGENSSKAIKRIKENGVDLKKIAPNLFLDSLYTLNLESNSLAIQRELSHLNLMTEKFTKTKWLQFTNKQLELLIYYDKYDQKNFTKTIHSLAQRLDTDHHKAYIFYAKVHDQLNLAVSDHEFSEMLKNGEIDDSIAKSIFTKKSIRTRLDENTVSPTMVTLPDDFIHPFFNRVLTVREMARLQSFDDSFEFLGKRTTGGSKRALETPQFTQVGNAVPPLLARAVAEEVHEAIKNN